MTTSPRWTVAAGVAGSVLAVSLMTSCATPDPVRLDSTFRIDGPMTVEMKGPVLEYEGTYVSEALFDAIETGTTRAEWVLAALGEPDHERASAAGGAFWTWRYRAAAIQGSPVKIMNIGGGDEGPAPMVTVIVHVMDDVVVEKWRG